MDGAENSFGFGLRWRDDLRRLECCTSLKGVEQIVFFLFGPIREQLTGPEPRSRPRQPTRPVTTDLVTEFSALAAFDDVSERRRLTGIVLGRNLRGPQREVAHLRAEA